MNQYGINIPEIVFSKLKKKIDSHSYKMAKKRPNTNYCPTIEQRGLNTKTKPYALILHH